MRSLFHTLANARAVLCMEVVTSSLQDTFIISHLMTCEQVEFVVLETETLQYIQRISLATGQQSLVGLYTQASRLEFCTNASHQELIAKSITDKRKVEIS